MASDPDDPTQPSGQIYYSLQQTDEDAKAFAIGNYVSFDLKIAENTIFNCALSQSMSFS